MPRRVGNGPGWGGPARSSDKSDKRKPFRPGNPGGTGGAKGYWGGGPIRSETRIASAVECKERITEVMRSPEVLEKYPTATIRAAEAMLDRLEGKPVQRNVNTNDDVTGLTDEEVEERIARLSDKS